MKLSFDIKYEELIHFGDVIFICAKSLKYIKNK
jgi:hypothetical protein